MSPCFMATPPAINFMAVEHHPFSWGIFHCQRPDCWRVHPITSHWIPWIFQLNPITSHYIKSYQSSIKSHCIPLNPMNIPWYPYYISIKSPFFSGILHPPWPAVTWDLHPLHEGSGIRRRGDAKPRYEGHMQGGEHLVHARPGKWSTGSFSRMAMGYPLLMV